MLHIFILFFNREEKSEASIALPGKAKEEEAALSSTPAPAFEQKLVGFSFGAPAVSASGHEENQKDGEDKDAVGELGSNEDDDNFDDLEEDEEEQDLEDEEAKSNEPKPTGAFSFGRQTGFGSPSASGSKSSAFGSAPSTFGSPSAFGTTSAFGSAPSASGRLLPLVLNLPFQCFVVPNRPQLFLLTCQTPHLRQSKGTPKTRAKATLAVQMKAIRTVKTVAQAKTRMTHLLALAALPLGHLAADLAVGLETLLLPAPDLTLAFMLRHFHLALQLQSQHLHQFKATKTRVMTVAKMMMQTMRKTKKELRAAPLRGSDLAVSSLVVMIRRSNSLFLPGLFGFALSLFLVVCNTK